MALPFTILKKDLKAKEELWKHSNISPCKNIIFKSNPLKEKPKSFKIYYNSNITNLKFQHKPKYHLLMIKKILI
jgi:hypothetical protein